MKATRNRFQQGGFTLIELVAVIGLAAVLVAGALAVFGMGDSGVKTNALVSQVNAIRSGVKGALSGQNSYGTGSLNAFVITAKALPSDLKVDTVTNTITNTWNGTVDITGSNATFAISYSSVPQDVCTKALPQTSTSGITSISVGGTAVAIPVTATGAQTACSGATNAIIWTSS